MNNFIDNIKKKKKNLTCFCVFGFIPENEEKNIFYCLIFMENHQYFIQSEIIIYKLIYLQKKKKKNSQKKKMEPFRRVSNEGGKKLDPVKEREKKKKERE